MSNYLRWLFQLEIGQLTRMHAQISVATYLDFSLHILEDYLLKRTAHFTMDSGSRLLLQPVLGS